MTPPIRIDFAWPQRRAPAGGAFVLLPALIAWTAALLHYQPVAQEVEALARQTQDIRYRLQRQKEAPAALKPGGFAPATLAAVNTAITQINLPWRDLFQIFETRALPTVTLLALEPDSRQRLLRVTAQARNPEAMADFVELLAAEPRFSEVVLIRHEFQEQTAEHPLRFILEARWTPED